MNANSNRNSALDRGAGRVLSSTAPFTKALIVAWGLLSALQGASIDYSASERALFASWEEPFVYLVYMSVLVAGLFSFASSRITSYVMAVVTATTIAIALATHPGADGLGLGLSETALATALAIRPAFVTCVLFFIAQTERRRAR